MSRLITMAYVPDGGAFTLVVARDGYNTDTVFIKGPDLAYVADVMDGHFLKSDRTLQYCGTDLVQLINDS